MSPFLDAEAQREHRARNTWHSSLMIAGIGALMLLSAWLIGAWTGVAVAAITSGLLLLLAPRLSPEVVMRLYRAHPVEPRHTPQIARIVTVLAERAELPRVPRLYVVPSTTLNAFATGAPDHAVIAVTEGLLRRLSLRELAGVLAHEISHIRNNDLKVLGLADAMTRFTQALASVAFALAVLNLPAMLLGLDSFSWVAIALLYLTPAATSLMQLALSRTREFDADLEAVGLTGDPAGLASALGHIERAQGRLIDDLLFPPTRRTPQPSLLRTHPETKERLERLASLTRRPIARPMTFPDEPLFSLVGLGPAEMTPRRRWPGLWY